MATSQNGWLVITSGSSPLLVTIPRIIGRVRGGDVAAVLTYLVGRFDAEVEDVDAGADDWGYAYRPVAGQTAGFSNHASGTALDLNATRHPLGATGTFAPAQVAALRRILADLGGVVRWGGGYAGRKDEMHFEIVATAAQVAAVAARIRSGQLVSDSTTIGGPVGPTPSVTAPSPLVPEEDIMASRAELQSDIATALAPIAQQITALIATTGRARWYKIAGTALAWLDLGTARRMGTAGQYAAAPSGIVELEVGDPFWLLPIIGPAWGGEGYRRPGATDVWFPDLVDGRLVRRYPGRQGWIDAGSPPITDLPASHGFWSLPVPTGDPAAPEGQ